MVQYHFKTAEGPSLGPIEDGEFKQRLQAGEINDQTMVWRSGMVEWTTFAALRARDEQAAKLPPPLPGKAVAHQASPAAVKFLACGTCGQDWPESLLSMEGSKPICGNCQRRERDNFKQNQLKNGVGRSNPWVVWLKWVSFAILLAGMFYLNITLRHKHLEEARLLKLSKVHH
jgi:hypothetical protein